MNSRSKNDDKVTALVKDLCRYLRANPQACDTADGIARWWLDAGPQDRPHLQRALDYLEREGLIENLSAADGRRRYRRRAEAPQADARMDALIAAGRRLH